MLNIPVSNPRTAQLITIAAGIVAIVVAQFAPHYSVLLSQILQVLGIGAIGVGGASITSRPDGGDAKPVATKDPEPTRVGFENPRDPEPPSATMSAHDFVALQLRRRGLVMWMAPPVCLLLACDPRKPPCDESKLRAIDEQYATAVLSKCLAKYDRKEDCDAYWRLSAEHKTRLREACGSGNE